MPDTQLNGVKIHYRLAGRGKPLLMIGGFNSSIGMWFSQIPVFRPHFRLIMPDNRGSGRSGRPQGPYTVKSMAQDCLALLDYLEIKEAGILGVSMGALIAQEIALNHPDRVSTMVLSSAFARIDDHSGPTPEMRRLSEQPINKAIDPMAELMLNRRIYRWVLLPLAYRKNQQADLNSLTQKLKACGEVDFLERLKSLKIPTLVLAGKDDRLIRPESAGQIAGAIPWARLVMIEGGSHLLFIEKARQFNREVLSFLLNPGPPQIQH